MGEGHPLSNFLSHQSRAHIIILLPASCVPDVRWDPFPPHGVWDSQSKWFKSCPAGSKSTWLLFSSTSTCMDRSWSKCSKGIHGFPSYAKHQEVPSSQQARFLIFQSLCHPVKRGEKCEDPFERPPFPSWFSEHCDSLECHLSSYFISLSYWGLASPSWYVYITRLIPADTFC